MALSWISGYNNINYLNQMIKSVEDTLSNDYNNLDNIPIIKIISSTSNPQNIWELKEGMYLIDGIVYVDNNTSYEVSNLFVSMTARLENGKYVLSAFIPFFKGLYEYILKSNSTEYEEHQIVILATHERMLTRYNETPYEPNGDYNPATKKYVDDKANEIITELDNIGVNKETITSLKEENRIRDIKLQALLSETSDRNISISEDTRYFDMPLSIDNGIVTINEMIGDTLVNVCDQEESVAITKSYTVENENHIALQGEYDGSCRPIVHGNTLVNHNADWDGNLQTGVETNANGIEDVQVEGIKGQEVSVVVEGNTVLNHALGKTASVTTDIAENLVYYGDKEYSIGVAGDTLAKYPYKKSLEIGKIYTLIIEASGISENTDNKPIYSYNSGVSGIGKSISNGTNIYRYSPSIKIEENKEFWIYYARAATITSTNPIIHSVRIYEGDHTTNPKYVKSNNGNYVDLTVANDMSSVVEIEGRTMVNVCDQKDPIAITKSYTVENSGNHVALQGEYDGSCRPVIQGNTMVNLFKKTLSFSTTLSCNDILTMNSDTNTYPDGYSEKYRIKRFECYYPLKTSTTYTLCYSIIENNNNYIKTILEFDDGTSIENRDIIPYLDLSSNRIIFTTPIDKNVIKVWIFIDSGDEEVKESKITNVMLFEGDLTQTPELIPTEYVEGLKSSFEEGYIPENLMTTNVSEVGGGTLRRDFSKNIYKSATVIIPSEYVGKLRMSMCKDNLGWYDNYDVTNTIQHFSCNADEYYNCVSIAKADISSEELANLGIIILEGDWTHLTEEDFKHLGKYKVEYKVTGKNKFDIEYLATAYPNDFKLVNGELSYYENIVATTIDLCQKYNYSKNTQYTLSGTLISGNGWFTIDYTDGTRESIRLRNTTPVTSSVGKIVQKISVAFSDSTPTTITNIQIEEGTTATEYEPYKEYTKTFYLNSPLLEGDTLEDVNGVATHVKRWGQLNLLDLDTWGNMPSQNTDDTAFFQCALKSTAAKVYCNNFVNKSVWDGILEGITINGSLTNLHIRIKKEKLSTVDLNGFKEWLRENPTTVVYKLASPIYEKISTESILCDSYVNGHLDFDSAVPVEKVGFRQWWKYVKYLKPNTIYTIQFESDNVGESDFAIGGKSKHVIVTKGLNKVNITTNDIIPTSDLWTEGIGFNASNIVVTEAIDADFDYFEGLQSSFESCYPGGKNLFDEKWRTGYIGDSDGVESSNSSYAITDFISLKSNTTYTIQGYCPRIYMYDGQFNYLGFKQPGAGTLKYQTYTFTTDDKWVYMRLRYIFNSSSVVTNLQELIEGKCQLEEGSTATSYEPFIDKYKVDVKVTGKNKFDLSKLPTSLEPISNGFRYDTSKGTISVLDMFNIDKNKQYTLKCMVQQVTTNNYSAGFNIIYEDDTSEACLNYNGEVSRTTKKAIKDIRMTFYNHTIVDITNIQIEEGTVVTSYEPYIEYTKTFYLNSPLLEGDKIVTKNGKVYHYHKMGRVVLDGNKNSAHYGDSKILNNSGTYYKCYVRPITVDEKPMGNVISNTYPTVAHNDTENFGIRIPSSLGIYMSIPASYEGSLQKFCQSNPVTVVYELASPYYELIDEYNNTILNIPKNVAHLTHTSAVPVNNTVFTNYKDELNVLESNTQYRVMFDCNKVNIPFTVTLGGTSQTVTSKIGTHSLLITTPSTLVDKNLVIDGIGRCGIDNIRIFKGNVEYDYVKGLWSGYEERKLENLMDTSIFGRTGVHTNSIMTINDNYYKLEIGTCKNTINMVLILYHINLVNGNIYTLIMDYKTPDSIISPQIGNYSYINMANKRMKTVTNSTNYCDKFLYYDKYVITISQVRQNYPFVEIKNILILEGDWTDNPPTYEEVMANEGKYAVKVKLDTNATIFGKGGRL